MNAVPRPSATYLPALLLALISAFGILLGLVGALLFGLYSSSQGYAQENGLAWAAALFALLNVPALLYAAPRARGGSAPQWQLTHGWRWSSVALLVWVAVLVLAGRLAASGVGAGGVWMPLLSILAVGLPIWWLIEWGRRGLRTTPLRTWGVVSTSLLGMVPLVIVLELVGFLILGAILLIWLVGSSPDLLTQIQQWSQDLASGDISPEALLALLQPYLEQPGVVLIGMFVLAVLTPMLEEFFKPLALWFIPGRRLTQAEGFTLGMIAGGIFALVETLGALSSLSQISEAWLPLVLIRVGSALLHITCSGLTGWGLAAAWQHKGFLKCIGLVLLAVIFHGAWNLMAQLLALQGLAQGNAILRWVSLAAPFAMALEAILIFGLLSWANRHLRAAQPPPTTPPQAAVWTAAPDPTLPV